MPAGVFVLMDKTLGLLRLLPFELDYGFVEGLLQRVERLQPLVEQGVDPDPTPWDQAVCGGCGFKSQCWPARNYGEGVAVLDDEQLQEDLEQREKLRQARGQYEELDKAIKARLKRDGITSAICGPFTIEATERPVGEYTVKARVDTVLTIRRS